MAINKGSSKINKVFVGNKEVKQIYCGGTGLIYELAGISANQNTGTSASPLAVKGASSTLTITSVGAWTASSNSS